MLMLLIVGLIGVTHKQVSNYLSVKDPTLNLLSSVLAGGTILVLVGGCLSNLILLAVIYSVAYWNSDKIMNWIRTLI